MPIKCRASKAALGTRYLGAMAWELQAAFGLGADECHIAIVDADGVALAAIQGLNHRGRLVAFAFDGLHTSAKHQRPRHGELEQRRQDAFAARHDQDRHRQSANGNRFYRLFKP